MTQVLSFAIGDEVSVQAGPVEMLGVTALVTGVTLNGHHLMYHLDGAYHERYFFQSLRLVRRATEITMDVALRMMLGTGPSIATRQLDVERRLRIVPDANARAFDFTQFGVQAVDPDDANIATRF